MRWRRLGALLKYRYPQAAYWTTEEKRRYWAGYEKLMALAVALEAAIDHRGLG
ncbi:MAG: hypothetical protein ACYDDA_10180 [Acidiferrobacteraceae bacterium]